jgi:subtilase family serine protease
MMSLNFQMTAAQQTALTQLLADQQNPASPRYHQWLTPEQFAVQFGLAAQDVAKVTAWLSAQGFTVTSVAHGGLFVQFSGTVEQAQKAFGTEIHTVSLHGEQHIANVTAPSLPKAIAAVAAGIGGLDDFVPKARVGQLSVTAGKTAATPEYSSGGTNYVAPGDFYTIYDEKALLTGGTKGTGVTIVVAGQTDIYPADIAAFQSASGLANKPATVTVYGTDPGFTTTTDLIASEQSIEWAGAVAPGATIQYVNTISAVYGSLVLAIDNDLGQVIADSYGSCEADLGTSAIIYYSQILEQAASEGITVTTPSGEFGATDCDSGGVASAVDGYAVDFPGSSPLVTAVGGTEFNENGGTYWSGTNGTNGGSALSYIPEMVWNDDSTASTLLASGGGASLYFSKPAWQRGNGVPADFSRDVPDVSLDASPYHDPLLICTQGFCTSGFTNGSGALEPGGGTALTSSVFAGLIALVVQKTGGPVGVANPTIYALASSGYGNAVFNDVKTGTNASPCTSASINCPNGGTIGFSATAGYDQATGWGSVNAFNLVNDWALVTGTPMGNGPAFSLTNVAGNATSVSAGTAVVFNATVTSGVSTVSATPTGSVQITVDGAAFGGANALNGSGMATYTLNTTGLNTGQHTVQATYLGDSNYQGSKGTFLLTISAGTSADFTLTPTTPPNVVMTANAGSATPGLTLTVTALNGFTGNITFAAGSLTPTLMAPVAFTVNPVVLSSTTPSGSTIMTLLAFTLSAKPGTGSLKSELDKRSLGAFGGAALAAMLMLVLPRKRRFASVLRGGLLMVFMAVAAAGLSGCSSTPNKPSSSGYTITPIPTGTYNVVVTATGTAGSTAVTHVCNITFIVQ